MMFFKSKFFRAAAALTLIFCLGAMVLADTIRLKDGSVIKGKIIGFRDGQFIVSIGDGARARQMTFFADEVETIEFDSPSTPPVKISNPPTDANTNRPANNPNANTNSNPNSNAIIVGKSDANKTNPSPTPTPNLPVNSNTNTIIGSGGAVTVPTSSTVNPNENKNTSVPVNNPNTNSNPSRPKPIQLSIRVLADNTANGWTNAGWVVKKGQKIRIIAKGQIDLRGRNEPRNSIFSSPAGIKSLKDEKKLMPNEPTGGLIAVIGDNNNDFIFIGSEREFTAQRDGMLFLGVNEDNLTDNSGAFDVTVEIEPNQNL